jgi:hypothetical protein
MYAKQLVQQMRAVLPNFNVNKTLKTVKISRLFSKSAKAENLSLYDTPYCNYHYVCHCKKDYIGISNPQKARLFFITKSIVKHTRKISQKQNPNLIPIFKTRAINNPSLQAL